MVVSSTGEAWTPVSFEDRGRAHALALDALEADVQHVAEGLQNNPDGIFGWALTPDWHRRDDLKGLVHWYYLIELVSTIHKRAPLGCLKIDDPVPSFVRARLARRLGVPLHTPLKSKLHWWLGFIGSYTQAPARLVGAIIRRRMAQSRNAALIASNAFGKTPELLVQMPPSSMRHRYGDLLADLSSRYRIMPFGLDIRAKHRHHETRYDPGGHYRLYDLIDATRRAHALRRILRQLQVPEPMPESLISPKVNGLILCVIDYLAIERMIKNLKPNAVLLFWPVTRPKTRMVIEACRRRGVPTVLIPGRTLSRMKAAERLIPADLHSCRLDHPNLRLIVPDTHSLEVCLRSGFRDEQLRIGSTNALSHAVSNQATEVDGVPFLLLLLQADRTENNDLLEGLRSALPSVGSYRLLVRTHPKMALSDGERALVAAMDPDWQDVSGQKYDSFIAAGRTVAVTVFSTSGVDATAHGSGLLWLPWITDQAITMCDVMAAVGEIMVDRAALARQLLELKDSARLAAFCDRCTNQGSAFNSSADIRDVFAEIERDLQ